MSASVPSGPLVCISSPVMLLLLAHQNRRLSVSYCDQFLTWCPSCIGRPLTFSLNDISSRTTGANSKYFYMNVPHNALYQNSTNGAAPPKTK